MHHPAFLSLVLIMLMEGQSLPSQNGAPLNAWFAVGVHTLVVTSECLTNFKFSERRK